MPYLRPFQDQPQALRMPKRVEQWGEIWKVQQQQILIPCMEQLIIKGQEEAKHLPFLSDGHIWKAIKTLSIKAPGLDGLGISFDPYPERQ